MTDDQLLQEDLAEILNDYPALRTFVPKTFPTARRFELTVARMKEYSDNRQRDFFHQLNLPLALHYTRHGADPKARQLTGSLVRAFDDFATAFEDLPGVRGLLEPLWDDPWTQTPQLWSVAACVYMALCYRAAGIKVLGFENSMGGTAIDDITVERAGRVTHIEVEAWHRSEFGHCSDAELREKLEQRANEKAGKKFGELPATEVGVVAEVCVVKENDLDRSPGLAIVRLPNRPKNWGWIAHRLVGVVRPDGFGYAVTKL